MIYERKYIYFTKFIYERKINKVHNIILPGCRFIEIYHCLKKKKKTLKNVYKYKISIDS